MYEVLHQRNIRIEVITWETNSLYGTNIKTTNFPTKSTLDGAVCSFFTSVIMGIQMGEIFKLC
jgi:hypothetical protein